MKVIIHVAVTTTRPTAADAIVLGGVISIVTLLSYNLEISNIGIPSQHIHRHNSQLRYIDCICQLKRPEKDVRGILRALGSRTEENSV